MKNKNSKLAKVLIFFGKHLIPFYILSFTWGLLASSIGLLILIPFLITGKVKTFCGRLYGVFPKCFGSGWGFEMGCFFFTSYDCSDVITLKSHECGHGLQNILWGPLTLFVITIPSIIRFWIIEFKWKKGVLKDDFNYDSVWFEYQASTWGYNYVYLYNEGDPTK